MHHGTRSLSSTTHFLSVLLPQVQALSLLQGLYSSPDPTPSSLTLCLSQELVPFWLVSSLICFSRIKMCFFVISIISCLWFGGNTLQDTRLTPGGAESRFRLVAYRASLLPASFSLQPCFLFILLPKNLFEGCSKLGRRSSSLWRRKVWKVKSRVKHSGLCTNVVAIFVYLAV